MKIEFKPIGQSTGDAYEGALTLEDRTCLVHVTRLALDSLEGDPLKNAVLFGMREAVHGTNRLLAAVGSEDKILTAAKTLRDECYEAMSQWKEDARVCIKGNDKSALDVLYVLNAIGVPGCRVR